MKNSIDLQEALIFLSVLALFVALLCAIGEILWPGLWSWSIILAAVVIALACVGIALLMEAWHAHKERRFLDLLHH